MNTGKEYGMENNLLNEAVAFAARAHAGQFRKGTQTPYIVHPMEAAAICASFTDDEEVLAAAVLHDVVEDAGVTADEIAGLFGGRVASIVAGDSEDKREEQPASETWRIRKEEGIASRTHPTVCPHADLCAILETRCTQDEYRYLNASIGKEAGMDEARIGRILKQWAQPDPAFREDLLQRCLLVLDRDGGTRLDDASLEMLAAAGPGFSDDPAFDDDPKKA